MVFQLLPATSKDIEEILEISFKYHFLNYSDEQTAVNNGFSSVVYSKEVLLEIILEKLSKVVVLNGKVVAYFLFCSPKVYQKVFGLSFADFLHAFHVAPAPNSVFAVEAFVQPGVDISNELSDFKEIIFSDLSKNNFGVSFTLVPQNSVLSRKFSEKLGYRFLSAQEADLWCDVKGSDKSLLKKLKRSPTVETVVWNLYNKSFV